MVIDLFQYMGIYTCDQDVSNIYKMHFSCSTLKGNGINGEIPEEFGNLSNLNSLDLENNHLTGRIPSSLGNLKKLQFL